MVNNGKLRKKFKLENDHTKFKASAGVSDKENPGIIYLKLDTWATYTGEGKSYKENIEILNSNIRNKIKTELRRNKTFDSSFIYTPEIKRSFFIKKSNFHASFEFTLKQRLPINTNYNELKKEIESLCEYIIKNIENSVYFKFAKSKTKN